MTKEIRLIRGEVALVDDADYPALAHYRWRLNSAGYAIRSYSVNGKEIILCMHREIMHAKRGQIVDHIDHDKLNNTRANLRFITQQQNLMSRRRFKNNTSGYKGVNFQSHQWHARIEFNEQALHLGHHATPEAAACVYDAAARRLFGEYAVLNFPDEAADPWIEAYVEAKLLQLLGMRIYP